MKRRDQAELEAAYLDELIDEIMVDANGEDEQLWAFRQAFEEDVAVPCEATEVVAEFAEGPLAVARGSVTRSESTIRFRTATGRERLRPILQLPLLSLASRLQ
jgi:hypothetical protein